MTGPGQTAGQKRKVNYDAPSSSGRAQKRHKSKDARAISSQTADKALSATGELSITSYIKAREFEISALDKSMQKSRKGLMSRAFQQLPRHMRRRTASHNVKKVPRRLRKRAEREMREDNTPTVTSRTRTPSSKLRLRLDTAKKLKALNIRSKKARKKDEAKDVKKESELGRPASITRIPRLKKDKLANPPKATSKFKRRQVNKTWLPTHLWHTKRAHMTRPTEPLWRMALPLKPTEQSYRPTHRAAGSRGCVAWDTSYVSTIGCHGTDLGLENMLKSLGFHGETWRGMKYKKWKTGSRFAEGWACVHNNDKSPIAPVTVLWQQQQQNTLEEENSKPQATQDDGEKGTSNKPRSKKTKLDRRIKMIVHPSAFHQLWNEVMRVAKMQKPQVLMEDLRFEIGSIMVQGPGSTEALAGVFKPVEQKSSPAKVWTALASLSNPSTLPLNATLALDITDPRLCHPPKKVKIARDETIIDELNQVLVSWPPDQEPFPSALFSHKARYASGRSMPSQKAINRRRSAILPGQDMIILDKDPSIPVILLAHRALSGSSSAQGSWTVLMPWSAVDPVWRTLMCYPLSSGGSPRFGGIEQIQQVAFEQCSPWFPGDYPGTDAGKAWDRTQTENCFDSWIRRPPSRRYAWDTLDLGLERKGELGRGWACDWEFLLSETESQAQPGKPVQNSTSQQTDKKSATPRLLTQRQRKSYAEKLEKEENDHRRNTSSPESGDEDETSKPLQFSQLPPARARNILQNAKTAELPKLASLATVRIELLTRGTPCHAARIYRLPTSFVIGQVLPASSNRDQNEDPALGLEHTSTATGLHSSARPLINPFPTEPQSRSKPSTSELRQRWTSLDPNPTAMENNPLSSTNLSQHQKKIHTNRHNDPRVGGRYHPSESLEHIRVFPPNAPKEVKEMYGPPPPRKTHEQILKEAMPLPNTIHGFTEDENVWEKKHIPCPDPHDLIGFVTSGGYNLAEGRGTAVGAIWVQKVIQGWRNEDQDQNDETLLSQPHVNDNRLEKIKKDLNVRGEDQKRQATAKKLAKQHDRERHLCIVRNAGESIGRLGIWEVC